MGSKAQRKMFVFCLINTGIVTNKKIYSRTSKQDVGFDHEDVILKPKKMTGFLACKKYEGFNRKKQGVLTTKKVSNQREDGNP